MDRGEIDRLVQRLVDDPHDEQALAYAHQEGEADPKGYAMFLERVGGETRDSTYASHWLTQAAEVWSTTLGDAHRAARVLMLAIEKDPTAQDAAGRLADLYREKGDAKALVALLDRRTKALTPVALTDPAVRGELAGMHEELGRLWTDPPLSQPKKAVESYRRAMELDPTSAYAIYNVRELYKQLQEWSNAIPLYGAELELERDPARRVGLLRDEAATRKQAGDLRGATQALASAREIDAADPALQQEYGSSVLDRIQAGEGVPQEERRHAAALLVALAEAYEGEHGLAYAGAALDIEPGHDRGIQLYAHYANALGQERDLGTRYNAYLGANPDGSMADEVKAALNAAGHLELASNESLEGDTSSSLDESKPNVVDSRSPRTHPDAPTATDDPAPSFGSRRPPALSPEKMQGILDAAQMLGGKGKKAEAFAKYKEVLESDPSHPEALGWTEDYLRSKRDYAQLRDVLLASIRATANVPEHIETRKERLREVAGLCEGNLRDTDGAIAAWRQLLAIDRKDESARTALMRLLEKSQRWDELANVLEQEATIESDVDTKVLLERKLARLQEDKRKDPVAAGEAWGRIARLLNDDDQAIVTASRLFEKGERIDLAAQIIAEGASAIEDPVARGQLMQRLAELREQLGDVVAAGDSYADAAEALRNGKLWEDADRLYSSAESWAKAAHAAHQRGLLTGDLKQQAMFFARAADYLTKANRPEEALGRLEEATDLDPLNDDYSNLLVMRYEHAQHTEKLVTFLTKRGDRLTDKTKRVNIRREAATLSSTRLQDKELSRELWLKLLEDGDDKEALERLIDDAVEREDHTEAATLLRRLGQNTVDKAEKARVALREAELLSSGVGDIDTAISRYETILSDLDPTCRPALQAIADLQEQRGGLGEAADALERELKLVADVQERGQIAARLARLYERLDDPRNAIRALDLVRKADLEDFDALTRLCELCELTEQWGRVAELLVERIEIEADESEVVELTKKLASMLADKLDRGDEALGALTDLADSGDTSVRAAYIALGDRLGWKGIVASKLKDWWFDARHGTDRTAALRGAFERFAEVGRDADAVTVAIELVRTKGADPRLANQLEDLAVKTGDHDALAVAHELLARERQGAERGQELVRQAEIRVRAGMARQDAISHGEQGLSYVGAVDAEPLLERLGALAAKPADVIDLYERQVVRSKAPQDRTRALARAAQVASMRGQPERARGFFELALSGAPTEETLTFLDGCARDGDKLSGGDRLRRALCQALAAGGHGARDGGRTRASLLRKAATIAHRDLNDTDQAFSWLADALVAHVDSMTLDMLETLGLDCGDPRRAESALSHALSEVFDGPLVRQLLARRAKIRRDQLVEPVNAAADLRKLHDLAPTDQAVMDELAGLLMELADYKALVQLYEDQILRGKDMTSRAELARKVARIWEEQLADQREASDAWRRVLRMKAGDEEATRGLERSKANQLKKPAGDAKSSYAPPKLVSEAPVPPPQRPAQSKAPSMPPPSNSPPKRPSAPRFPVAAPYKEPREVTSTSTSTTAGMPSMGPAPLPPAPVPPKPVADASPPSSRPPRSVPPPLPLSVRKPASVPPNSIAGALRGIGSSESVAAVIGITSDDNALEGEIDASLDRLELEGPGNSAPSASLPNSQSMRAAMSVPPAAVSAPPGAIAKQNGEHVPRAPLAPNVPQLVAADDDDASQTSIGVPRDVPSSEVLLDEDSLEEVEIDEESDIVIADDLAEIVEDDHRPDEEATDVGPARPFRAD